MIINLIIKARQVKTEKSNFVVYRTKFNDTFYEVKFTRACPNAPTANLQYVAEVDTADIFIKKGEEYTTKDGELRERNKIMYISKFVSIDERSIDDIRAENSARTEEALGL